MYVDDDHRKVAEAFRELANAIEAGGNLREHEQLRLALLDIKHGIEVLGIEGEKPWPL
jgi:hypothetical protein